MDALLPVKDRIDAAALALFAARGVGATTTKEIAARAGVAEGSIYRHYESKEALARSLFVRHYDAMGRRLKAVAERPGGFRARLDAMVREVCIIADDEPAVFAFLLLSHHDGLRHLDAGTVSPVTVVCEAVAEAMARGEIAENDPELMTAFIFGAVVQPATFRHYGRIDRPMRELAPSLAGACWRALA
jgi:AcrR family transcriptional regulator